MELKLLFIELFVCQEERILMNLIYTIRVNELNSESVLNTGNSTQNGPSLCSEANGRVAAYQYVMEPMAAKQPIFV